MASFFKANTRHRSSALRDLAILATALVLVGLFVQLGFADTARIASILQAIGGNDNHLIISLLLLNIALTLYSWRRYRDASRELVERTLAEEKADALAATDPLTGFLNRKAFGGAVSDRLKRARAARQAVAVMIVDLDGFRQVNEAHGHLTGDALLRTVADLIRRTLPMGADMARVGADEFALALTFDGSAPTAVERIAGEIVERIGRPFDFDGVSTHVSASIGLARTGLDCQTAEALSRRADIAMGAAKKLGRSRWVWFDASMERELDRRNAIETGLRGAINDGELVPFYEPQIDLVTQSLHGFEMLARWQHPEWGLVMPDTFIPVAEESGLIGDLSLSLMRQAFAEARGWDAGLTLSVNISPIQLKDPWLAQKITKLLVETGFNPERLEIEITESALFENFGLAQSIIASLKNQGIRLALDDFGSGYSSLAHLRALPFDRIKIDRSFIAMVNEDEESRVIVTAITRMAESLGLLVTAEGIEDEVIEARLRGIGAYQAQGYLFGKPMPAPEVRKLLSARALLPTPRAACPAEVVSERVRSTGRSARG